MQIYVLRHAIAEDAAPGQSDSERRLTLQGKKKLRKILSRARTAGVEPDIVLTSPYVRAVETAEIALEQLCADGKVVETEVLTPASNPLAIWEEIRRHQQLGQIILVGHNPLLSEAICFLIGACRDAIDLRKGALACVEVSSFGPQPQGTLVWLMTARIAGE
jgi:phosphohistidine phosphatase